MQFASRINLASVCIAASLVVFSVLSGFSIYSAHTNVQQQVKNGQKLTSAVDTSRRAHVEFQRQVQEWKNILLRGNDEIQFDKFHKQFKERSTSTQTELKKTQKILGELEQRMLAKEVDVLIESHDLMLSKYENALLMYDKTNPESAFIVDKAVKGMDRDFSKGMDTFVSLVTDKANLQFKHDLKTAEEDLNKALIKIAIAAIIIFALIFALLKKIKAIIWRQVGGEPELAQAIAKRVAEFRLAVSNDDVSNNIKGSLIESLNLMQLNLINIAMSMKGDTGDLAEILDRLQVNLKSFNETESAEDKSLILDRLIVDMQKAKKTVKALNALNTQFSF
jgi:hypothetical protein